MDAKRYEVIRICFLIQTASEILDLLLLQVYAIDRIADRLKVAQRFGAFPVPEGNPVAYLKSKTGGRGADCIMEAVGSPGALRCAFDAVRMGGKLLETVTQSTPATFAFK